MKCFIGKIYTSFKPLKIVESIIVLSNRIIYAGKEKGALKICKAISIEEEYLNDKVIIPGFIDSHLHLDSMGEEMGQLSLKGTKSIEELKAKLKDFALRKKEGWIYGRGWDQEVLGLYPTKEDIDEIVKDRPVLLLRICGHAAVINSKLMQILGYEKDLIKENEVNVAASKYKESLTKDEIKSYLLNAMKYCASQGVTCVGIAGLNIDLLDSLIELNLENRMPIRVRVYIRLNGNKTPLEILRQAKLRMGFGNGFLKIMGFKIIADGALGIRTAFLTFPYNDDSKSKGNMNLSPFALKEIIKEADENGFQVAVHAIGDATIDHLIASYKELSGKIRHRIEHASVIREDQILELSKLNVVACVQPHFVISDSWAMERLGIERMKWLYPFKSMLEKGVKLSFSTDCPVEPLNPWETIYASVTRGKYESLIHYDYIKNEKLNLIESLHAYTFGSAYAMYEESNLGSLDVGKLADFIIVNKDPFELYEKDLKNVKTLATFVNGIKVYPN